MNEAIIIPQKKGGSFLYAIGAFSFSLLSLLFIFIDFSASSGLLRPITQNTVGYIILKTVFGVGFLFFGYGFFYFLKRARQRKAILLVDDRGITDNSSAIAFGFIPWSDINDIYLDSVWNNTFIELVLRNENEYINRSTGFRRMMILANKKMKHQSVCITLNGTGVSPYDVFPQIQEIFIKAKSK